VAKQAHKKLPQNHYMLPDLKKRKTLDIGVISDTHGSLGSRARDALGRADVILHAGDFDTPEVLDRLEKLAPVMAVRGNMDYGSWANHLPVSDLIELSGVYLYMLHNLNALDLDPAAAGIQVVVSGHTHQPAALRSNGILFLNPGSPTSPRYGSEPSVAMLRLNQGSIRYQFIEVE